MNAVATVCTFTSRPIRRAHLDTQVQASCNVHADAISPITDADGAREWRARHQLAVITGDIA